MKEFCVFQLKCSREFSLKLFEFYIEQHTKTLLKSFNLVESRLENTLKFKLEGKKLKMQHEQRNF